MLETLKGSQCQLLTFGKYTASSHAIALRLLGSYKKAISPLLSMVRELVGCYLNRKVLILAVNHR